MFKITWLLLHLSRVISLLISIITRSVSIVIAGYFLFFEAAHGLLRVQLGGPSKFSFKHSDISFLGLYHKKKRIFAADLGEKHFETY